MLGEKARATAQYQEYMGKKLKEIRRSFEKDLAAAKTKQEKEFFAELKRWMDAETAEYNKTIRAEIKTSKDEARQTKQHLRPSTIIRWKKKQDKQFKAELAKSKKEQTTQFETDLEAWETKEKSQFNTEMREWARSQNVRFAEGVGRWMLSAKSKFESDVAGWVAGEWQGYEQYKTAFEQEYTQQQTALANSVFGSQLIAIASKQGGKPAVEALKGMVDPSTRYVVDIAAFTEEAKLLKKVTGVKPSEEPFTSAAGLQLGDLSHPHTIVREMPPVELKKTVDMSAVQIISLASKYGGAAAVELVKPQVEMGTRYTVDRAALISLAKETKQQTRVEEKLREIQGYGADYVLTEEESALLAIPEGYKIRSLEQTDEGWQIMASPPTWKEKTVTGAILEAGEEAFPEGSIQAEPSVYLPQTVSPTGMPVYVPAITPRVVVGGAAGFVGVFESTAAFSEMAARSVAATIVTGRPQLAPPEFVTAPPTPISAVISHVIGQEALPEIEPDMASAYVTGGLVGMIAEYMLMRVAGKEISKAKSAVATEFWKSEIGHKIKFGELGKMWEASKLSRTAAHMDFPFRETISHSLYQASEWKAKWLTKLTKHLPMWRGSGLDKWLFERALWYKTRTGDLAKGLIGLPQFQTVDPMTMALPQYILGTRGMTGIYTRQLGEPMKALPQTYGLETYITATGELAKRFRPFSQKELIQPSQEAQLRDLPRGWEQMAGKQFGFEKYPYTLGYDKDYGFQQPKLPTVLELEKRMTTATLAAPIKKTPLIFTHEGHGIFQPTLPYGVTKGSELSMTILSEQFVRHYNISDTVKTVLASQETEKQMAKYGYIGLFVPRFKADWMDKSREPHIFVSKKLKPEKRIDTLFHELGHDWLQEKLPKKLHEFIMEKQPKRMEELAERFVKLAKIVKVEKDSAASYVLQTKPRRKPKTRAEIKEELSYLIEDGKAKLGRISVESYILQPQPAVVEEPVARIRQPKQPRKRRITRDFHYVFSVTEPDVTRRLRGKVFAGDVPVEKGKPEMLSHVFEGVTVPQFRSQAYKFEEPQKPELRTNIHAILGLPLIQPQKQKARVGLFQMVVQELQPQLQTELTTQGVPVVPNLLNVPVWQKEGDSKVRTQKRMAKRKRRKLGYSFWEYPVATSKEAASYVLGESKRRIV